MSHRTRIRGLAIRAVHGYIFGRRTPSAVIATKTEWLVECEKCGRVDKALDEQTARARAARHEEMPHR